MQWIEVTIKTAPGAIDLVCDRLTVLGFDSFIVDDQDQFHEFLEENRQYWDYVDEGLEQQMQGLADPAVSGGGPGRAGDHQPSEGPARRAARAVPRDRLLALWTCSWPTSRMRTGKTTGSSITSRRPSAKSCWSCRVAAPGKT